MKYFDRDNNIVTDTILGMTHLRTLNEFIFNSIVTLFSLIFGYFNSMFLEKTDLFIAVLLVVCFDNILGQIIAIKIKKYNKRLKKWGTSWETQKALKGVYYIVGYSAIVAVVLSIQKGFPAAGFLDEAVVLPILIFQLVSILKNASLLGVLPQGLLLQLLENIDNYKDNAVANIKETDIPQEQIEN